MERKVWKLIYDWFSHEATCDCRIVATYNYRRELQRAGVVMKKVLKGRPGEEDRFQYSDRLDQTKTVLELRECLTKVAYEQPRQSRPGYHELWMLKKTSRALIWAAWRSSMICS